MTRHSRKEERAFYQDGRDFYSKGKLIASYPDLVKDDSDLIGTIAARKRFLLDHPQFKKENVNVIR